MALIIFRNEPYIQVTQALLLFLECECSQQFHIFGDEQWLCSGRTHLMVHWNPITASTKQNELLLTRAAATESAVGGRNPPCWGDFLVVLHFFWSYSHSARTDFRDVALCPSGSENTTWPNRPVLQSRKHARADEKRGDLQMEWRRKALKLSPTILQWREIKNTNGANATKRRFVFSPTVISNRCGH